MVKYKVEAFILKFFFELFHKVISRHTKKNITQKKFGEENEQDRQIISLA